MGQDTFGYNYCMNIPFSPARNTSWRAYFATPCLTAFLLLAMGASWLRAADLLESPRFTNFWKSEWPPRSVVNGLPPLTIGEVFDVKVERSAISFNVRFTEDNGSVRGFTNASETGFTLNLEKVLNAEMQPKDQESWTHFETLSVTPQYLDSKKLDYRVLASLPKGAKQAPGTFTLRVSTCYIEAAKDYAIANFEWCSNRLSGLRIGTNLEPLINAEKAEVDLFHERYSSAKWQNSHRADIKANLEKYANDTNLPGLSAKLNSAATNLSSLLSKAINTQDDKILSFLAMQLTETNYSNLTNELHSTNSTIVASAQNTRNALFWVLLARMNANGILAMRSLKSGTGAGELGNNKGGGDGSAATDFQIFAGKIAGFTNFVQRVEQLPYKEVAMNLGQGIANHFTVLRVVFLNRTTNDLLLYGDRIRFDCHAREYSYDSPSAYKYLLRKVPEESVRLLPSKAQMAVATTQFPQTDAPPPRPPSEFPKGTTQTQPSPKVTASKMAEAAGSMSSVSEWLNQASTNTLDASKTLKNVSSKIQKVSRQDADVAKYLRSDSTNVATFGTNVTKAAMVVSNAAVRLQATTNELAELQKHFDEAHAKVVQAERQITSQKQSAEFVEREIQRLAEKLGSPKTNQLGQWTTLHGSKPCGEVFDTKELFQFTPIPLTFLIGGFDSREFATSKAKTFRILDLVANSASAAIPFVNIKAYADYTGIYSGIALPLIKKCVGDMTEIQRQSFLQESLPQYQELKVGQTVSKLVYLPRFGADKLKKDRVVFVSEVGDKNNFHIAAAMIKNLEEETNE